MLRELKREEMFSLFHEEESSAGSPIFQGIVKASLCLPSHHHARSRGTEALPPLLKGTKDVGGITAELSQTFIHFSYLLLHL